MPVIFQIPFNVGLTVQPKKMVSLHTAELETPLILQPALGSFSHLCCGRCWTGTSTHMKRSAGACGSSLSPCTFTRLLHVITVCARAGNREEPVASCCCPLLQLAPQLIKADLCIASSPLSFVHRCDISCLLVAATQVLRFPSQLSPNPMFPFPFFSGLATDKYQHPKSLLSPPTVVSTWNLYCSWI